MRRVNPQVDGDGRYAFVGPRDAVRLGLDLRADLIEIGELLPFAVEEFAPFCEDGNGEHRTEISGGCAQSAREENNASVRGRKKKKKKKQSHSKTGRRGRPRLSTCGCFAHASVRGGVLCVHPPAVALISCRTRGLRVTMPDPRGRKSLRKDIAHYI